MPTVLIIVAVSSFLATLVSIASPPRLPLWVPVLLLSVFAMLLVLPK